MALIWVRPSCLLLCSSITKEQFSFIARASDTIVKLLCTIEPSVRVYWPAHRRCSFLINRRPKTVMEMYVEKCQIHQMLSHLIINIFLFWVFMKVIFVVWLWHLYFGNIQIVFLLCATNISYFIHCVLLMLLLVICILRLLFISTSSFIYTSTSNLTMISMHKSY